MRPAGSVPLSIFREPGVSLSRDGPAAWPLVAEIALVVIAVVRAAAVVRSRRR